MSSLGLDETLEAASAAEPADRISYRDAIAGFGTQAVEPMSGWTHDERLGAFAVRLLERLAGRSDAFIASTAALNEAIRSGASPAIRDDARDALERLGATIIKPARRRSRATGESPIGSQESLVAAIGRCTHGRGPREARRSARSCGQSSNEVTSGRAGDGTRARICVPSRIFATGA